MNLQTLAKFLFYRNRPFTRWHEATDAEQAVALSDAERILTVQAPHDPDMAGLLAEIRK